MHEFVDQHSREILGKLLMWTTEIILKFLIVPLRMVRETRKS